MDKFSLFICKEEEKFRNIYVTENEYIQTELDYCLYNTTISDVHFLIKKALIKLNHFDLYYTDIDKIGEYNIIFRIICCNFVNGYLMGEGTDFVQNNIKHVIYDSYNINIIKNINNFKKKSNVKNTDRLEIIIKITESPTLQITTWLQQKYRGLRLSMYENLL